MDCEVARTTANIKDWARGPVFLKQGSHRGLRCANIPGWDVFVYGIKKGKWVRTKPAHKESPQMRSGEAVCSVGRDARQLHDFPLLSATDYNGTV